MSGQAQKIPPVLSSINWPPVLELVLFWTLAQLFKFHALCQAGGMLKKAFTGHSERTKRRLSLAGNPHLESRLPLSPLLRWILALPTLFRLIRNPRAALDRLLRTHFLIGTRAETKSAVSCCKQPRDEILTSTDLHFFQSRKRRGREGRRFTLR